MKKSFEKKKNYPLFIHTDYFISESELKIVNVEDITKVISVQKFHTSGIKHVSYHPSDILISTSDVEGVLRFLAIPRQESSSVDLTQKVDGIIPKLRGDDAYASSKIAWHKSGQYFAVPTPLNSVAVYNRDMKEIVNFPINRDIINDIKRRQKFNGSVKDAETRADRDDEEEEEGHGHGPVSEAISDLCWSPSGAYLAISTADGLLLIWDVSTRMLLRVNKVNFKITSLSWNPKINEISFATSQGSLHTFSEAIDLNVSKYSPFEKGLDFEFEHFSEPNKTTANNKEPKEKSKRSNDLDKRAGDETRLSEELEDNYDNLDDNLLGSNTNGDDAFIEDDDGTYAKEIAEERIRKRKRRDNIDEDDSGDEEQNGDQGGFLTRDKMQAIITYATAHVKDSLRSSKYPSFQQGSTRWQNGRRHLTVNFVGYVWTLNEGPHNDVSVEFFDVGSNRKYHFRDTAGFDLACLTKSGVLFARSGINDKNDPVQKSTKKHSSMQVPRIYYRPHLGGSTASWEYKFIPQIHGTISNIALSETRAQVYTSEGYVFTFTLGGTPVRVNSINDRVITSAAFGDYFMTVCEPPGAKDSSCLRYSIENANTFEMIQNNHPLSLSPGSRLVATFFSASGDPCIYDSNGSLKILTAWRAMFQAPWIPIFDARVPGEKELSEVTQLLERAENDEDDEDVFDIQDFDDDGNKKTSKDSATEKEKEIQDRLDQIMSRRFCPLGLNEDNVFLAYPLTGKELEFPLPSYMDEFELQVPAITESRHEQAYLVQSVSHELAKDRGETGVEESDGWRLEMNKSLLRLFGAACGERQSDKALEIARLLSTSNSLALASKIAVDSGLPSLANAINDLREVMIQKEQEEMDGSGY